MEVKPFDNHDGNESHASNDIDDDYAAPTEGEAVKSGVVCSNALNDLGVRRAPESW